MDQSEQPDNTTIPPVGENEYKTVAWAIPKQGA